MIKGRDYIFPNITAEMGRTGYNNKSWILGTQCCHDWPKIARETRLDTQGTRKTCRPVELYTGISCQEKHSRKRET